MTKGEVVKLCNDIIDDLLLNETTYNWKKKFLYSKKLNSQYLNDWAKRDDDIKPLVKLIDSIACDNIVNAVQGGLLKDGFAKWLLMCRRNNDYTPLTDELNHEKMRAEIDNIKTSTIQIEQVIEIGFPDENEN